MIENKQIAPDGEISEISLSEMLPEYIDMTSEDVAMILGEAVELLHSSEDPDQIEVYEIAKNLSELVVKETQDYASFCRYMIVYLISTGVVTYAELHSLMNLDSDLFKIAFIVNSLLLTYLLSQAKTITQIFKAKNDLHQEVKSEFQALLKRLAYLVATRYDPDIILPAKIDHLTLAKVIFLRTREVK